MIRSAVAVLAALATAVLGAQLARAQAPAAGKISGDVVRIGVLTDMTGYYSDLAGPGSVTAAKMAVEDFGGKVLGKPIDVISADHQNKADIASNTARRWFDEQGVDVIADLVSSSTAGAVMPVAAEKKRITLLSARAPPRSPATSAPPTTSTTRTTPGRWRTAPARRS